MNALFLSIGHVASMLGVFTKTLRRWDKKGLLNADVRTPETHRGIKREESSTSVEKRVKKTSPTMRHLFKSFQQQI